jgi:hypothetical protein
MVADGTHLLVFEVHFATLGTLDDFSSYLYATVGTYRSLVADLSPTFRAFDDGHYSKVIFYDE